MLVLEMPILLEVVIVLLEHQQAVLKLNYLKIKLAGHVNKMQVIHGNVVHLMMMMIINLLTVVRVVVVKRLKELKVLVVMMQIMQLYLTALVRVVDLP